MQPDLKSDRPVSIYRDAIDSYTCVTLTKIKLCYNLSKVERRRQ